MNKLNLLLSLGLLTIISLSLANCSNDITKSETTKNAKVENVTFVEGLHEANFNKDEIDVESYLEYVYFDGIPANEYIIQNNIDKSSFINLIKEKIYSFSGNSNSLTNKLSREEIRDAMINECENAYCCGLDDACVIAVKIAYHIG